MERTTDLDKILRGAPFTWGVISDIWMLGEYAIVKYTPYKSTESMYHTWVGGKDTAHAYHSLDAAMAGCIAYKHEGANHHGDAYFMAAMLAMGGTSG